MQEIASKDAFARAQKFEVTEYEIYQKLLTITRGDKNRKTIEQLAEGSKKHAQYWENITGVTLHSSKVKLFMYSLVFRVFGLTFGVKLMEASEKKAERIIAEIISSYPEHMWILDEEKVHEQKTIELIDESFLNYLRSVVLGANDSIVSTVGTAAGLSVALSSAHLIGMTTFISGATAALSMSSSEYLSSLSEKSNRRPLTAGIITGITYICVVIVLLIPYFVLNQHYIALFVTLGIATIIVTFISFYISIIQQISFIKRFLQNIGLSFGIAIISFLIGYLVNTFLGLEI